MGRNIRESTTVTKMMSDRLSDLVYAAKEDGISQKELSRRIGISSGALSEWCNDKKTMDINNLVRIARYFGVTTDWLVGLTNDRDPKPTATGELGLSENAVQILRNISGDATRYARILSTLIEHKRFIDLLVRIDHAAYIDNEARRLIKQQKSRLNAADPSDPEEVLDALFANQNVRNQAEQANDWEAKITLPAEDAAKFYLQYAVDEFRIILEEQIRKQAEQMEENGNAQH